MFVVDKSSGSNDIIFRKGDKIITYVGEFLSRREIDERYDDCTAPYGIQINNNNFRDASLQRGTGSLVNNNRGRNNAELGINNSFFGKQKLLFFVK